MKRSASNGLTRREILELLGAGAGAALLASCAPGTANLASPSAARTETPRSGGVLLWLTDRDIDHYDFYQTSSSTSTLLNTLVYSSLLRCDPLDVTKLLPDLAESWDVTPDALTYTFHLRQGVRFHDGVPLTSADVKFSLDRLYNPATPELSTRRDWFAMIRDVQASDASTVKVNLKYPAAEFLPIMGMVVSGIYPKHVVDAKGDMKKDMVGTGAFRFKGRQPGVSIEYEKNPDYYEKGRPYLDGVKFVIVKDEAARSLAFRAGQAHIAIGSSGPTPQDGLDLESTMKDKVTVWRTADLAGDAWFLNMKRKPWDDVRVRTALHLAMDRQAYAKLVYQGAFSVRGFVPSTAWSIPDSELKQLPGYRQPKDADRAEARKLLAAAGYGDGFSTTILQQNKAVDQLKSTFFLDTLSSIGIKGKVDIREVAVSTQLEQKADFDVDVSGVGRVQVIDPSPFLNVAIRTGGAGNFSQYSSAEIDKLVDDQARELDQGKRKAIIQTIERKLFQEVPYIPIGNAQTITSMWNTVRNWMPHDGRFTYLTQRDTWLAQ